MARKRILSPDFFKHYGLYQAEVASGLPLRLAFAGLWTVADRRGIFRWKAEELKLDALPYDTIDFGAALSALESARFIRSYEVEGKRYGVIPSFGDWQTFHKHEKPSNCPLPPAIAGSEPAISWHEPSSTVSITASTSTSAESTATTVDSGTMSYLLRCAVALNTAQQSNPAIVGFREIPATSLAGRVTWEQDGIPVELAESVILERCAQYRPSGRNRQIGSLSYFDAALRDAWEISKQPAGAVHRSETSDAVLAFAAIRRLVSESQVPGRGIIRILPRADVEKLGLRALAAYDTLGGAKRFTDDSEKLGYLQRDFEKAYAAGAA